MGGDLEKTVYRKLKSSTLSVVFFPLVLECEISEPLYSVREKDHLQLPQFCTFIHPENFEIFETLWFVSEVISFACSL